MTKPHRATPEQWETVERYADTSDPYSCFLELRARIEALEAGATCPHVRSSDEGTSYCALAEAVAAQHPPLFTPEEVARIVAPVTRDRDETGDYLIVQNAPVMLLDRVAQAIYAAPNNAEGWRSEARAAILEVAAWLRSESEGHLGSGLHWARRLQQEANQ